MTFHGNYTRALTFENTCLQGGDEGKGGAVRATAEEDLRATAEELRATAEEEFMLHMLVSGTGTHAPINLRWRLGVRYLKSATKLCSRRSTP